MPAVMSSRWPKFLKCLPSQTACAGWGLECQPVSTIIADTSLGQTNVSFHLRILREAGLVRPKRHGALIYYCLPDPKLLELLGHFRVWEETIKKTQGI